MSRKSDYITIVKQNTRQLWDAMNTLKSLQLEWNSLDYGNTGTTEPDEDGNTTPLGLGDGVGENAGITQAEVGAVVFDSTNALITLMGQGHGTNLAKLL